MGVECEIVRTYVQASHIKHVIILEVLHGVLCAEAHNNGLKKISVEKAQFVLDFFSCLDYRQSGGKTTR